MDTNKFMVKWFGSALLLTIVLPGIMLPLGIGLGAAALMDKENVKKIL